MIAFSPSKQKFWVLFFVLAVTFAALSSVLGNHFTNWDDGALLVENNEVHDLSLPSWRKIFTTNYVGTYIPLTILSFNIETFFFHDIPFYYHFDNLLLHLAVVALVFVFAQRLGLSLNAAGFTALLFGIHPMHVESVAWTSQRKDVLYSVFYLLAMLKYWDFLEHRKWSFYTWALLFGLCSILSKPMAYSLPVILLLCDVWKGRVIDLKVIGEKIPFFVLIGAVSLITSTVNPQTSNLSLSQSALVWIWVFVFHIQKFILPSPLIPAYEMPQPVSLGNAEYIAAVLAFGVFIVAAFFLRRQKWFWFAVLFYFISNSMIILRAAWEFGNNTVVADRFMYLPSLGICLALGAWYQNLKTNRRFADIVLIVCMMIFASLIVLSSAQTRVWRNNISLWSYVIKYYPEKILVYQNRAAGYVEKGRYDLAMKDLDRGLALEPRSSVLYFCRADLFEKTGDLQKALQDFDRALDLDPDDANAYFRRGAVFQALRQNEKALQDYDIAIAKKPYFDRALYNRGIIHDDEGKAGLALADYADVIRINPRHKKVYNNRAVIYIDQGEYEKAEADLFMAIKLDPENAQAYGNLGSIAFAKQDLIKAMMYFTKALTLDPDHSAAYVNRAVIYAVSGDDERAFADLDRAIALDSRNGKSTNAYYTRAFLNYNLGKIEQALADVHDALKLDPQNTQAKDLLSKITSKGE